MQGTVWTQCSTLPTSGRLEDHKADIRQNSKEPNGADADIPAVHSSL
jgi:hypothetical protein